MKTCHKLPAHLSYNPNSAPYFVAKKLAELERLRKKNARDLQRIKDLCRQWEQLPDLDNISQEIA